MKYFVANWKGHKNLAEAAVWVSDFNTQIENYPQIKTKLTQGAIKIILCPPHSLIYFLRTLLAALPNITLGAQDVSRFGEGSYTGEPVAKSVQGLVTHTIIGHSERRHYLGESEEAIREKMRLAKEYTLAPILCVRGPQDTMYKEAALVAYEPVSAVGTGHNEPIENVLRVKRQLAPAAPFLYGGSVNKNNVKEYIGNDQIDGLIVGRASLNPHEFFDLLSDA